jgi:glycosyltransferase involved in cell wall biosynthesis
MMNLLFLTPQLPYPAYQGTTLRNLHILRGLAKDNSISLLSFSEPGDVAKPPSQLRDLCAEIISIPAPKRQFPLRLWQMISTNRPDMALRLWSAEFAEALQKLLLEGSFDLVQIEGIELAWVIPTIRKTAPGLPILYDAHNAEALLQARAGAADEGSVRRLPAVIYSRLQSSRLTAYESWVCRSVDQVTAVSEADSRALTDLAGLPPGSIPVIPNSIDVTSYHPGAEEVLERAVVENRRYQYDIVFSGKMDYRPNVDAALWFADEIWPLLKQKRPEATWAIVGQKPHPRLAKLTGMPDVTLTGWVPDVKPFLFGAKIFIMPFRVGSGTRLKLIEALAAGRAVVSTPVGVEGFPVVDGRDLLLGETEREFAEHIVDLLDNPQTRTALGSAGLRFAQSYDWRLVVPQFQAVYDNLILGNKSED